MNQQRSLAAGGDSKSKSESAGSTLVYVGCGSEKRGGDTLAKDLYTSDYFGKKREYAETIGDDWTILSAKYGALAPGSRVEPYDMTIDDYPLDGEEHSDRRFSTIEEWAASVLNGLSNRAHNHARWDSHDRLDRVVVLAGQSYVGPLREGLVALGEEHGFEVSTPFDDTGGIGEQISWLGERSEEAGQAGQAGAAEQAEGEAGASEPGGEPEPDPGTESTSEAAVTTVDDGGAGTQTDNQPDLDSF
jgi:hypothetical protein